MENIFKFITEHIGSFTVIFTGIVAIIYTTREYFTKKQTRSEYLKSFEATVSQLASSNTETQLSAAILLRRFLNIELNWFYFKHKKYLFDETINVISSILRVLPTGIYQKTLGDGLAYATGHGLSMKDLQRTNLQNLYLGNKEHRIQCHKTDFYMADLSYALLENIDGEGIIFYYAILMNCNIKNCNFQNANFAGADLTNTFFKNVNLYGADFSKALNIPTEIQEKLVKGKCMFTEPITTKREERTKTIFFSMPGIMTKQEELITLSYKNLLKDLGYEIIYYGKDDYPRYGQLNNVKRSILASSGVIAFGFKQINIINGTYHPHTDLAEEFNNKWLSTPWSEIEVGMAIMRGIPVLLVHDKEINNGIFDTILSEYFVGEVSSDIEIKKIGSNPTFNSWIRKIELLLPKTEKYTT